MQIISQFFGILGMMCAFVSFQCKENKKLLLWQTLTSLMFIISFSLQGAILGMTLNILNLIRNYSLIKFSKKVNFPLMIIINIGFVIALLYNYESLISVLLMVAQVLATVFMYTGNGKYIRLCQVCALSPAWLLYNISYMNIGGILTETFNIISVVISIIRYGLNGFEMKKGD